MRDIKRLTNQSVDTTGIYINKHTLFSDVDTHWHKFYEIEYIESGSATVSINEKNYSVKANTLLFLSPVDFEKIEINEPLTVINLAFSSEIISSKILSLLPFGSVINDYNASPFKKLMEEADINDRWFFSQYKQIVNCILVDIVRDSPKLCQTIDSLPIQKAINYMELNFKDVVTLEQISKYVGLTPSYFSALFLKVTNTNFKSRLNELRLDYAAKMLRISDFEITEICYASGFNDFSSFSRAFKKHFSLSPSKYREQNNYKSKISTR